jgi:hypothetical protein
MEQRQQVGIGAPALHEASYTMSSLADVTKEVRIIQGDRNGLLLFPFCHTLCSAVTANNDGLSAISARAVSETVTASSVFSNLFTRHVPRLRPRRRRITLRVQLRRLPNVLCNYLQWTYQTII